MSAAHSINHHPNILIRSVVLNLGRILITCNILKVPAIPDQYIKTSMDGTRILVLLICSQGWESLFKLLITNHIYFLIHRISSTFFQLISYFLTLVQSLPTLDSITKPIPIFWKLSFPCLSARSTLLNVERCNQNAVVSTFYWVLNNFCQSS